MAARSDGRSALVPQSSLVNSGVAPPNGIRSIFASPSAPATPKLPSVGPTARAISDLRPLPRRKNPGVREPPDGTNPRVDRPVKRLRPALTVRIATSESDRTAAVGDRDRVETHVGGLGVCHRQGRVRRPGDGRAVLAPLIGQRAVASIRHHAEVGGSTRRHMLARRWRDDQRQQCRQRPSRDKRPGAASTPRNSTPPIPGSARYTEVMTARLSAAE